MGSGTSCSTPRAGVPPSELNPHQRGSPSEFLEDIPASVCPLTGAVGLNLSPLELVLCAVVMKEPELGHSLGLMLIQVWEVRGGRQVLHRQFWN